MCDAAEDKKGRRKVRHQNEEVSSTEPQDASDFTCHGCNIMWKYRIGIGERSWPSG